MEKLYKGRYLIAKYDLNDHLIATGTTPKELGMKYHSDINDAIKRKNGRKYKIYLIDCLEKHDDVFAEEDEIFVNLFKTKTQIIKEYAESHHISIRTVQRRIQQNKLTTNDGWIHETR